MCITPSHFSLFHLFFIYAHSETHRRSCKKIKEIKAIFGRQIFLMSIEEHGARGGRRVRVPQQKELGIRNNDFNTEKISGWKWTNQKFLVKFIRIFLVKSTRILIFTRIIILIRILVISTRILNLTRKFWFIHFSPELLFNPIRPYSFSQWTYHQKSDTSEYTVFDKLKSLFLIPDSFYCGCTLHIYIFTHTHAHAHMCTQHIYRLRLGFAIMFVCTSLSFFFFFIF